MGEQLLARAEGGREILERHGGGWVAGVVATGRADAGRQPGPAR
jgi:hypothetical protein